MPRTTPKVSASLMRRTVALTVTSIIGICAMILLSVNAFAYNLEGPKWANQPPPHTCCAHINVQESTAWYPNDQAAVNNGISAWNGSPNDILFYKVSSSPLYIDDTYNSSVGWDGITYYSWDGNNHFTSVKIYLNYYYTQNYVAAEIQGIAVHELGHGVGLAHAGGCVIMVGDTYTRWTVCRISTPQTDDNNGIDALY